MALKCIIDPTTCVSTNYQLLCTVYVQLVFLNSVQMSFSKMLDQSIISNIKHQIIRYNMPSILLYGDSHIERLEDWIKLPYNPNNLDGPTPIDHKALSRAEWCAFGATTFETVHKKLCGLDVPSHQKCQGNQWHHVTQVLKMKPDTLIVSMDANDISNFDSCLKPKLAQ